MQHFCIILQNKQEVYQIMDFSGDWLDSFNPDVVQYMHEPGPKIREPVTTVLCTFGSYSPLELRYKEFIKNRWYPVYMPLYTLPELLAIAEYIRENE